MKKINTCLLLTIAILSNLVGKQALAAGAHKAFSANKAIASSTLTQTNYIDAAKPDPSTEKVLNDVKVYPNPVGSQLNLTYRISKDANVTIKVMDVLGGEIAVLFSKQLPAGEQSNSFPTPSNLSSGGIYFLQIIAGDETIIKRISVA